MKKKRIGGPSWDVAAKKKGMTREEYGEWRTSQRVAAMKRGHAKAKRLDVGATATQDASRFTQESVEWDGKDTAKFYRDGKLVGTSKAVSGGHVLPPVMCVTDDGLGARPAVEYPSAAQAVEDQRSLTRVIHALAALSQLTDSDRTELRKRMAAVGEWDK